MSVVVLLLPLVHMWLYHYKFLSELGENGFDIREENGIGMLHTSYTVLTEVVLCLTTQWAWKQVKKLFIQMWHTIHDAAEESRLNSQP
jgi:hypothetical protein